MNNPKTSRKTANQQRKRNPNIVIEYKGMEIRASYIRFGQAFWEYKNATGYNNGARCNRLYEICRVIDQREAA